MTTSEIVTQIRKKKSFLCIGLDVQLDKIPRFLLEKQDPIFEFNKEIIDATHHLCVAYKPNTAFYEAYGTKGWRSLKRTISYLNEKHPEIFTIADAKRGDIGNSSSMYAKAFFEELQFDSVTVSPYMGKDSVEPFLAFQNKHVVLLALTSNTGAFDFQTRQTDGKPLYKKIIECSKEWSNKKNLMYVVGATKATYLSEIRKVIPDAFLLVPGVGAQGGSLEDICKAGMNDQIGILVNSSRNILYASNGSDFARASKKRASELQVQMEKILIERTQHS